MVKVLVADDDDSIRLVLSQALDNEGYEVSATPEALTLLDWVQKDEGDIVLLDVIMPDANGFDILPEIKRLRPELPVIILSAQNTLSTAVKATEYGAYDYLPKPFDLNELTASIASALKQAGDNAKRVSTKPTDSVEDLIVGRSSAMQTVYRLIARLAQSDLRVLIHGESGTGKELVAKALHIHGARARAPFVAVNMGAIPSDLIESELFGHEKGAFTGAIARKAGRFEQAEGGTLFLDEIGDMPLSAQTRLLRVLQEKEYTPLGGLVTKQTDVRIIAATHADLQELVSQGKFREDLFYRLNVVPLVLPPLRDRLEDVPDLVQHFLKLMAKEGYAVGSIEPEALTRLKHYHWPGNIRELENLLRRLAVVYPEGAITLNAITNELEASLSTTQATANDDENKDTTYLHLFSLHVANMFQTEDPPPGLYHRLLSEWEKILFDRVLAATLGNQVKAADILGINRNTLRKKLLEHGMVSAPSLPKLKDRDHG